MLTITASTRRLSALLLAAMAALVAVAPAQEPEVGVSSALERPKGATRYAIVDWGLGVLEAQGTSLAPEPGPAVAAALEARRKAVENLRLAASSLPLLGDMTVEQAMETYPDFGREVDRRLDRAEIVDEWPDEEGYVTAVARLPLRSSPNALATLARRLGAAPPLPQWGLPEGGPADPSLQRVVVIDARGLKDETKDPPEPDPLKPCIIPRLVGLDEAEEPWHVVCPEGARLMELPVRYLRTTEELHRLVGDHQIIRLEAAGAGGPLNTDIVMEDPEAVPEATAFYIFH